MTSPLVFWVVLGLGPIPFWHLLLHAALPFWKRRPLAFYGSAAALWTLFLPLASWLASASSPLFVPSAGMKLACLVESFLGLGVWIWSVAALSPKRFFGWAVLRPDDVKPLLIRSGPYRFAAHPSYFALLATVASSFLASGEAVLLGALFGMAVLLAAVVILEQRELRARLTSSGGRPQEATAAAGSPRSTTAPSLPA